MTAPLATNDFLTAWVPLHRIKSLEESPLVFQSCSHKDLAAKVHLDKLQDLNHDLKARKRARRSSRRPIYEGKT